MIDILNALLTPVIAIIASYIAYQQYALEKHNNDVEVYDRRLRIYRETIKLIRNVESNLTLSGKAYHSWELLTFEAELLFDEVVVQHLDMMSEIAANIAYLETQIKECTSDTEANSLSVEQANSISDLTCLTRATVSVFKPYLNIIKERHKIKRTKSYMKILNEHDVHIERSKRTTRKFMDIDDDIPF